MSGPAADGVRHAIATAVAAVWVPLSLVDATEATVIATGATGGEGRVNFDGVLAIAVLPGALLETLFDWWWADAPAGYGIVFYATREAH